MAFLIPMVIPLYNPFLMLGWKTRKKLIQEHSKRVFEVEKKITTVEKEKLWGLFGFSPVPLHRIILKVANQEALIIRNWRIEGLWLDECSWCSTYCEILTRDAFSLNCCWALSIPGPHSLLYFDVAFPTLAIKTQGCEIIRSWRPPWQSNNAVSLYFHCHLDPTSHPSLLVWWFIQQTTQLTCHGTRVIFVLSSNSAMYPFLNIQQPKQSSETCSLPSGT